jgi:hypothetical protein
MKDFSVTDAVGAGFRLIGRKPLAVAAWGFVAFMVAIAPALLLMAAFMPSLMAAGAADGVMDPGTLAAWNAVQPITWITGLVANAVVFSAVYRAVLTPQDDRTFYLRFGKAELWQGLLQFALGVGMFVILLVMVLIFALIFGAAFVGMMAAGQSGSAQWPAIGVGGVLAGLVFLVLFWWLALRFSLAGPMTFADKQFRLFESWSLTKGHSARLFGVSLLIVLMVILLYLATILVVALMFGVLGVGIAGAAGAGGLEHLFDRGGAALAVIVPLVIVGVVIGCAIYGMFLAVVIAPWAEVYRQLSGRTVDAETFA